MTKNTPRIFISLLLMLLCIGILPVSAFASGGDYPDDTLPTAESSAAGIPLKSVGGRSWGCVSPALSSRPMLPCIGSKVA